MVLLLFSSCEGYKCGSGIVKDKITGLPLDSVSCEVLANKEIYLTDSTGKFDLCNPFGTCLLGCKDIVVTFKKNGYKVTSTVNPNEEIILLER